MHYHSNRRNSVLQLQSAGTPETQGLPRLSSSLDACACLPHSLSSLNRISKDWWLVGEHSRARFPRRDIQNKYVLQSCGGFERWTWRCIDLRLHFLLQGPEVVCLLLAPGLSVFFSHHFVLSTLSPRLVGTNGSRLLKNYRVCVGIHTGELSETWGFTSFCFMLQVSIILISLFKRSFTSNSELFSRLLQSENIKKRVKLLAER